MMRSIVVAYAILSLAVFATVVAWGAAFLGAGMLDETAARRVANLVGRTVDHGPATSVAYAALFDVLLMALFGVQHSVMARRWFKDLVIRFVPPPVERSTYVLFSSLGLGLLFWHWRPLPRVLWDIAQRPIAWCIWIMLAAGGLLVLWSVAAIDGGDLIGLRQLRQLWRGRPYEPPAMKTPGLYRWVRHPMMLGLLVIFWATPRMTAGHALFAAGMTLYILVGTSLEERSLLALYGQKYRGYQQRTGRLLPKLR